MPIMLEIVVHVSKYGELQPFQHFTTSNYESSLFDVCELAIRWKYSNLYSNNNIWNVSKLHVPKMPSVMCPIWCRTFKSTKHFQTHHMFKMPKFSAVPNIRNPYYYSQVSNVDKCFICSNLEICQRCNIINM
jgi:hypothetical protein